MIGSLGSGTSALKSFQRGMEVIGNDIANANTVGFKTQRVDYQDAFYNVLNRSREGVNGQSNTTANQVGSGVYARHITTNFNQGLLQNTGLDQDMAIVGNGFFKVVNPLDNNREYFTRAGNFRVDAEGYLVTQEGYRVQGLTGGTAELTVIGSSTGEGIRAEAGPATVAGGNIITIPITNAGTGYDPSNPPEVTIVGDGVGATGVAIVNPDGTLAGINITNAGSRYNNAAAFIGTPPRNDLNYYKTSETFPGTVGDIRINTEGISFINNTTSVNASGVSDADVERLAPGVDTFAVSREGKVELILTNGERVTVANVLVQHFRDPQALNRVGGNLYDDLAGAAGLDNAFDLAGGIPNTGALGGLYQGRLELSNSDLVDNFTNMITTQRSYQGAARIITTSDEMLKEAINLKR